MESWGAGDTTRRKFQGMNLVIAFQHPAWAEEKNWEGTLGCGYGLLSRSLLVKGGSTVVVVFAYLRDLTAVPVTDADRVVEPVAKGYGRIQLGSS